MEREFLQDPNGLYPYFGSVYSGGGFTLGAGYRQFYGDRTHADLKGLYSLKNYKLFELSTDSWGHADGRLDLHARAGWRDATQVAFYGLGMTTPARDRQLPDEAGLRRRGHAACARARIGVRRRR